MLLSFVHFLQREFSQTKLVPNSFDRLHQSHVRPSQKVTPRLCMDLSHLSFLMNLAVQHCPLLLPRDLLEGLNFLADLISCNEILMSKTLDYLFNKGFLSLCHCLDAYQNSLFRVPLHCPYYHPILMIYSRPVNNMKYLHSLLLTSSLSLSHST